MYRYISLVGLSLLYFSCFATSNIVYLNQSSVIAHSKILQLMQQRLVDERHQKVTVLQKRQNDLNQKVSLAVKDPQLAGQLSAQLVQLQQQFDKVNLEYDTELKNVQTDYFGVERLVLEQMLKAHKYSYILNVTSIYMTDKSNDISPQVTMLTDKAYEIKYKQ